MLHHNAQFDKVGSFTQWHLVSLHPSSHMPQRTTICTVPHDTPAIAANGSNARVPGSAAACENCVTIHTAEAGALLQMHQISMYHSPG